MIRNPLIKLLLSPFYLLYSALVRFRNRLFDTGAIRVRRLNRPVVSIGNLTAGGTGKTPVVAALGRLLIDAGMGPVGVLSRGYGREDVSRIAKVDGEGSPEEFGDEPVLLSEALGPAAHVWVGRRRFRAGLTALDACPDIRVFLLDDGFQHRRLYRDLDIVLLDCTSPFGGGKLLPFGVLREPVRGLKRADVVILTRSRYAPDLDALKKKVQDFNPGVWMTTADLEITGFEEPFTGKMLGVNELSGVKVISFAGIGNPLAFKADLVTAGLEVVRAFALRDHAVPSPERLADFRKVANEADAQYIVTTVKDWVKLKHEAVPRDLPLLVCHAEMNLLQQDELLERIKEMNNAERAH